MNLEPLQTWLARMSELYPDLNVHQPASGDLIHDAEESLGNLPLELAAFYRLANGLESRSFKIFPLFDTARPKKTWESLQRINSAATTNALQGDENLLSRFLVFADIGNGYAMIDRTNGTIWFEEPHDPNVKQTDFSFREFVETMLANAE